MNIKTIASSSKGCCYIVSSGEFQLLIECGVSLKKIREALDFDLSKVVGCLVSHEHGDHSGYLQKLEKETNIPIWCTKGTIDRFDLLTSNKLIPYTWVSDMRSPIMTPFGALALPLNHDVECLGFLIEIVEYPNKYRLFYATDTSEVKYTIPGLTHLMIEANYSFENMIESERNKSALSRACEYHLDIDKVVDFVKRHPSLEEIHLIHLSREHADAELFKKMVMDVSGVPVFVAKQ